MGSLHENLRQEDCRTLVVGSGEERAPVNLQVRFGDRYRVTYEESYFAERGDNARTADPWLQIIPCAAGHIFPWDDTRLAYAANRRGPIANQVAAIPGAEIVQNGDDGQNIAFPVELFDRVAEIVKPKRRRRLSAEQRKTAAERLRRYQFTPARQSSGAAEFGDAGVQADREAVKAT